MSLGLQTLATRNKTLFISPGPGGALKWIVFFPHCLCICVECKNSTCYWAFHCMVLEKGWRIMYCTDIIVQCLFGSALLVLCHRFFFYHFWSCISRAERNWDDAEEKWFLMCLHFIEYDFTLWWGLCARACTCHIYNQREVIKATLVPG